MLKRLFTSSIQILNKKLNSLFCNQMFDSIVLHSFGCCEYCEIAPSNLESVLVSNIKDGALVRAGYWPR